MRSDCHLLNNNGGQVGRDISQGFRHVSHLIYLVVSLFVSNTHKYEYRYKYKYIYIYI